MEEDMVKKLALLSLFLGIMLLTLLCAHHTVTAEEALSGEVIDGVRVIRITAMQFKFVPDLVRVKLGERVRLIVKSVDVTHGFTIDEFNVGELLHADKEAVIEFVPDMTGTFVYKCSNYCGTGHDEMKGRLIVIK